MSQISTFVVLCLERLYFTVELLFFLSEKTIKTIPLAVYRSEPYDGGNVINDKHLDLKVLSRTGTSKQLKHYSCEPQPGVRLTVDYQQYALGIERFFYQKSITKNSVIAITVQQNQLIHKLEQQVLEQETTDKLASPIKKLFEEAANKLYQTKKELINNRIAVETNTARQLELFIELDYLAEQSNKPLPEKLYLPAYDGIMLLFQMYKKTRRIN